MTGFQARALAAIAPWRYPARRFSRDRRGGVAMTFALALLPLIGFIAVALDYSRASDDRAVLQRAVDAAVIAASRPQVPDTDRKLVAEQVFYGALTTAQRAQVTVATFAADIAAGKITAHVEAKTAATMLKLGGFEAVPIGVAAEGIIAKPRIRQLDLALCIDASASMDATLSAVKTNAVNFEANLNAELSRRGIDPFDAMRVRVIFFRDYGGNTYYNPMKQPGDYVIGPGQQWVWVPFTSDPVRYPNGDPLRYRAVGDGPPMRASQFWNLPADRSAFSTFVQPETAWGGGDYPESGLECVNEAMDSPWARVGDLTASGKKLSQVYPVIAVWTMSNTHPPAWPLSLTNPDYPSTTKMPRSHSGLLVKWNDASKIDAANRMLVFFGNPSVPEDGQPGDPNGWPPLTQGPGFVRGGTLTQGNSDMIAAIARAIATKLSQPLLSH